MPRRNTIILLILFWLTAFVCQTNALGLLLPPLFLLIAWASSSGPSFKRMPRHPDINAVLNTKAMRFVLLRPGWTPDNVRGWWRWIACLMAVVPGPLIACSPWIFDTADPVTVKGIVWWTLMTPLMICAAAFFVETLLQQLVATPLTGTLIFIGIFGLPLCLGHTDHPEWTFTYRWALTGMMVGGALMSLWVLDMLRMSTPGSTRRDYLAQR